MVCSIDAGKAEEEKEATDFDVARKIVTNIRARLDKNRGSYFLPVNEHKSELVERDYINCA